MPTRAETAGGDVTSAHSTGKKGERQLVTSDSEPNAPALPRKTIVYFNIVHRHDLHLLHAIHYFGTFASWTSLHVVRYSLSDA